MSNEKGPQVVDRGDEISYPALYMGIQKDTHSVRIPINQPGFHGKYPSLFCVAQMFAEMLLFWTGEIW